MIKAFTIKEIEDELSNSIRWGESVNMVGLLFSRSESPNAKTHIIPQLNDFHNRSGVKIHFFCVGYGAYWPPDEVSDQKIITNVGGVPWYFSSIKFNELRKAIEQRTDWRYSGGNELLLINISKSRDLKAELILSSLIKFPLDQMLSYGVIFSVESFFFEIFKFSDIYTGNNAINDFINPPIVENFPIQHSNVGILTKRMNDCWKRRDYSGLLHASASIFETVAKHIVGRESINNQTLGSFFDLYRKESALTEEQLDQMLEYYNKRNSQPLAGHGNIEIPNITQEEAENIYNFTSSIIRTEYIQFVKRIAA